MVINYHFIDYEINNLSFGGNKIKSSPLQNVHVALFKSTRQSSLNYMKRHAFGGSCINNIISLC